MARTGSTSSTPSALASHEALIAGLLQPAAYLESVDRVERIDTHISTVLLAGEHAYKIRKPVSLGFLDFSTLDRRHADCVQELRLNRRTAPQIYRDVVAIVGPRSAPRMVSVTAVGEAAPIEFALRMRRFDPTLTFDRLVLVGRLNGDLIDRLARVVAEFHAAAEPAGAGTVTPQTLAHWIDDNFTDLRERVRSAADRSRVDELARWASAEWRDRQALVATRIRDGFVRECHGDLHLANIVLLDGAPVLFDAIEFNEQLRFIDVMNDVAFAFMDLMDHRCSSLAWRFIGRYLERTGDYEGLALLRLYAVYRALVRAKVALIREQQPQLAQQVRLREHTSFEHYLALAEQLRQPGRRLLVVMTGLSGSGKSTVAQSLAERLGGVRIRSDVERKRLFGLAPDAASGGAIYTPEATERTYERMAALSAAVIAAGVPVVADAAFLEQRQRHAFRDLAQRLDSRAVLVSCEAPLDVLTQRLAARAAVRADPSEADAAVLQIQLESREALDSEERSAAIRVDTAVHAVELEQRCAEVAAALSPASSSRPGSGTHGVAGTREGPAGAPT